MTTRSSMMTARRVGVTVTLLALAPGGCSDAPPAGSSTPAVEIVHWWRAGGEAEALSKLLDFFRGDPPTRTIIDGGVEGSELARATIKVRMSRGRPPDTFQANGGWGLMTWVLYNGSNDSDSKMEPIEDYSQDWITAIPPDVLDTVSFHEHIYAVPLNIHRLNTLFFNEELFAQYGLEKPTTLDELFTVAAAFKAHGLTPIALGSKETWTLTLLLFENLLVARAGGDFYQQFFRLPGDAFDARIRTALEDLRTLLSFTNADAPNRTWYDAIDLVVNKEAAMTIMGDWAKGYFASRPTQIQFGAIPMPGTAGTFVFTTDTFGLPKGARNRAGALELLRTFGSREGQDIFNPIKGSISARTDTEMAKYDPMAQKTIGEFRSATSIVPATAILAPQEYMQAIADALDQFAREGTDANVSVVIHTLDNWSDVLRSLPRR